MSEFRELLEVMRSLQQDPDVSWTKVRDLSKHFRENLMQGPEDAASSGQDMNFSVF